MNIFALFLIIFVIISSSRPTLSREVGFTLPLFHENHSKMRGHFKTPLVESPMKFAKEDPVYMVLFDVGEPSKPSRALFDTGSRFTWLSRSDYDLESSTSFVNVPFADLVCGEIPRSYRSPSGECMYQISYGSSTGSGGMVGVEKFKFSDSTIVDMVFGVDNYTIDTTIGVMGVYPSPHGVLSSLNVDRFSVCFPLEELQECSVRFGTDARLLGDNTPLLPQIGKFYFNVKSIAIASYATRTVGLYANREGEEFIFDTGASVTYLLPPLLNFLMEHIKKSVRASPEGVSPRYELCYLSSVKGLDDIKVTFEMDGGPIHFQKSNLWKNVTNLVRCRCMYFLRSQTDKNVFGLAQMRGKNFGIAISVAPNVGRLYYKDDDCSS